MDELSENENMTSDAMLISDIIALPSAKKRRWLVLLQN